MKRAALVLFVYCSAMLLVAGFLIPGYSQAANSDSIHYGEVNPFFWTENRAD